jgi:hypothetical protein
MTFKTALLTGTLIVGGLVADAGFVTVRVHEKKHDGASLRLYVPAIIGTAGLSVMPEEKLERLARDAKEFLPALRVAAEELDRIPDGPLVEVSGPREQVRVAKESGELIVDVKSDKEEVYVAVPLRTLRKVTRQLESKLAETK